MSDNTINIKYDNISTINNFPIIYDNQNELYSKEKGYENDHSDYLQENESDNESIELFLKEIEEETRSGTGNELLIEAKNELHVEEKKIKEGQTNIEEHHKDNKSGVFDDITKEKKSLFKIEKIKKENKVSDIEMNSDICENILLELFSCILLIFKNYYFRQDIGILNKNFYSINSNTLDFNFIDINQNNCKNTDYEQTNEIRNYINHQLEISINEKIMILNKEYLKHQFKFDYEEIKRENMGFGFNFENRLRSNNFISERVLNEKNKHYTKYIRKKERNIENDNPEGKKIIGMKTKKMKNFEDKNSKDKPIRKKNEIIEY